MSLEKKVEEKLNVETDTLRAEIELLNKKFKIFNVEIIFMADEEEFFIQFNEKEWEELTKLVDKINTLLDSKLQEK